jgi:hypothetical protein
LLAFACALQGTAQDDVLDVLDMLLTDLLARVESQEKRRRLRTIGDMDAAALLLREVGMLVLDLAMPDQTLRSEIFRRLPRLRIEHAVATIGELAWSPENQRAPEALLSRYSSVRQFVPYDERGILDDRPQLCHLALGRNRVLFGLPSLRQVSELPRLTWVIDGLNCSS